MNRLAPAAAFVLSLALSGAALADEPRTAAAVQAADDAWGAAEMRGDAAFVDGLLMPGYVSVGAQGKVTPKAAIVAHAASRQVSPEALKAAKAEVEAYRASHPSKADVTIEGDTAVLRWVSTDASAPVHSCDIFLYRDGRWRAIYSQHTAAEA